MKKAVEKGLAIALVILSIAGSFFETEYLESIIYAVIIPSFILSFISFIFEISHKCQENAEETAGLAEKLAKLEDETANKDLELYNKGLYEEPFVDGVVPDKIHKRINDSCKHLKEAITYKDIVIFCLKVKKICYKLIVCGYVLLFASLFFSPYLKEWLYNINLNCITLWSLTLLYFTLELKSECCSKIYDMLYKWYKRKQ